jgi:hypothetical protein
MTDPAADDLGRAIEELIVSWRKWARDMAGIDAEERDGFYSKQQSVLMCADELDNLREALLGRRSPPRPQEEAKALDDQFARASDMELSEAERAASSRPVSLPQPDQERVIKRVREQLQDVIDNGTTYRNDCSWRIYVKPLLQQIMRDLAASSRPASVLPPAGGAAEVKHAACPCLHTTPCHERCACVMPHSSSECRRCCSYGSPEQQRKMAEHLAALAPQPEEPHQHDYHEYTVCRICGRTQAAIEGCHHCGEKPGRCWWCLKPATASQPWGWQPTCRCADNQCQCCDCRYGKENRAVNPMILQSYDCVIHWFRRWRDGRRNFAETGEQIGTV